MATGAALGYGTALNLVRDAASGEHALPAEFASATADAASEAELAALNDALHSDGRKLCLELSSGATAGDIERLHAAGVEADVWVVPISALPDVDALVDALRGGGRAGVGWVVYLPGGATDDDERALDAGRGAPGFLGVLVDDPAQLGCLAGHSSME